MKQNVIYIFNKYSLAWGFAIAFTLGIQCLNAQTPYEVVSDGSFENYIGPSPITRFTLQTQMSEEIHAVWRFLGVSPDWFFNVKPSMPPPNPLNPLEPPAENIAGYINLGCNDQYDQSSTCFRPLTPTNPITAYDGNYYVGVGGCEGVFQTLASPIPPFAGFSITIRYMPRCPEALQYPLVVGVANNPTVSNCLLSVSQGTDHSAAIDPNATEPCAWNTFSTSFINMTGNSLNSFYVYMSGGCSGFDANGYGSNCYYYIDDVSVEVIDRTYFIEEAHEDCPTCTRCAQGHPFIQFPNYVDLYQPFVATEIDHARVVSLQVFDRHGSKLYHRWFGDHNCWPENVDNLPGYYPGWDFKNGNQYYPNDQYKVVATAWNCCADGSENAKFERVLSVTKNGHPQQYDYVRYDYSWFPSECCLQEIHIKNKILQGRPRYVVSERIRVTSCVTDQLTLPTQVYLQAPEINLEGETIVYDPTNAQFPAIIDGGFTAIAAPCTLAASYGCTPVPSAAGKKSVESSKFLYANSYWATAPPQVPIYDAREGGSSTRTSLTDERSRMQQIRVYPNPADQELTVSLTPGDEHRITDYSLAIFDSRGRSLPPVPQRANDPRTATLDISTLASGFYILRVSLGNAEHHFRFVKP